MDQGSTPSSTQSLPSFKDQSSEGSQRIYTDQASAQIQLSGLNQIYYLQADETYQDNDGSKTTYESCSSNSNTSDNDDQQLYITYLFSYKTVVRDEPPLLQTQQQTSEIQIVESNKNNERSSKVSEIPQIRFLDQVNQELPPQYKTLRLQNLKEGKIIQFEEFEPFNNSNRNEQMLTGGRLTSQSNSNKYSMSKTFNFQMAFICQNDDQSQDSINDSSRQPEVNNEQDQYHNDLTQRVDEKIRMIAEEYNLLAQTQGPQEYQKSQSFINDQYQEQIQSARQEDQFFKHAQKRNQSHESTQQPFLKTGNYSNTLISDQENNDFNAALNYKRNSLINKQRLQDRMSSTHNRTLNGTQQIKDLTFSKNHAGSFVQSSQNTVVRGVTQTIDTHSDSKQTANKHERQFSESSSYKNISISQPLNGMNSQSFNRTVAFGQGSINLNSKKLEDQVSELKYMLENVQCEAKNLKLLLNLKDDQLQMYESKNQDLINENEEFSYKELESKQKIEAVEEENLYLKAIINSHNIPARKITKINASVGTETLENKSQSCQATFPQVKIVKATTTSIGTSPCKKIDQYKHLEQNYEDLLQRYSEQEKENINFINQFNEQAERIKILENENQKLLSNQNHHAKESMDIKKSMQNENKSLYWQLESTKQQIQDRDQKIMEIMQVFEDTKVHDKKKSAKIKSLKKERDQLRIEILKLKQIYSEKCDGYKDSKSKLQKKLKKRDEVIQKLQEQVISIESYFRNLQQQSTRVPYQNAKDNITQMHPPSSQGKFTQDLDHQGAQLLRSSVSSRSLENTRNLNSTAKGAIRGLNQMFNKNEGSKEQSQNVRDLIQATNTHNTSLSNPPKSKNLTPGSLPSGTGIHGLHYSNQIEEYQRDKMMAKLKSQYRKLDLEEEKGLIQGQRQNQVNQKAQAVQKMNQNQPNHYISNDKSKSFYSSDIENNTLFDQNHIVMEDQSNSSNFFSNINNSNSHLFLDDSSVVGKNMELNYIYQSRQNDQEKYRQMMKNESNSQLKAFTDQQINHNIPKATQQPQLMFSNNTQQKSRQIAKQSNQAPQINHSQLQSLQQEDNQAYVNNQRLNHYTKFLHNPTSATHSKSPISKNKDYKKAAQDSNINVIQRDRSSQNLSQGDQANNTQNSIRQNRNDSATSSNRNLHQVKDQVRQPSSSSTNNTSAVYHNQVAMISYHSSSSGGSKQYQNKIAKLSKQSQPNIVPRMNNYIPYYNNQLQQVYAQQQPNHQYPPVNYQPMNYSKYYQVQQQMPQANIGYQSTINQQTQGEDKTHHKRQRSKQYDTENVIQDETKFLTQNQNIYDINAGTRTNNTKQYYQHGFN